MSGPPGGGGMGGLSGGIGGWTGSGGNWLRFVGIERFPASDLQNQPARPVVPSWTPFATRRAIRRRRFR